ncbi:hypothetical protein [Mycobacterium avium]|uniref:hypothetical protein n=1 Tax=Mycobacterium avium TaxID=1764 RepID=UPI001140AC56|nr:hypothetical protein [Mycobacterium avium]
MEKLNGKPVGQCFVMEFKDSHARVAIAAYADVCESENPDLAADLRAEIEREELGQQAVAMIGMNPGVELSAVLDSLGRKAGPILTRLINAGTVRLSDDRRLSLWTLRSDGE